MSRARATPPAPPRPAAARRPKSAIEWTVEHEGAAAAAPRVADAAFLPGSGVPAWRTLRDVLREFGEAAKFARVVCPLHQNAGVDKLRNKSRAQAAAGARADDHSEQFTHSNDVTYLKYPSRGSPGWRLQLVLVVHACMPNIGAFEANSSRLQPLPADFRHGHTARKAGRRGISRAHGAL